MANVERTTKAKGEGQEKRIWQKKRKKKKEEKSTVRLRAKLGARNGKETRSKDHEREYLAQQTIFGRIMQRERETCRDESRVRT